MNIQPCESAISIAYYIAKYVAKSELTGVDASLRDVISRIREEQQSSLEHKLFKIMMAMLNQWQVSQAECAYRLCHLKFKQSSRKCTFLNTRTPDRRYRVLRFTNEGSNGEFCATIFDRYETRPLNFKNVTLLTLIKIVPKSAFIIF